MRIVFTCAPSYGHLQPMLSLARAFVETGDEAVVASSPAMCARAHDAGFDTHAVGPDIGEWMQELSRRAGGEPGYGVAPDRILLYFLPRLFAEIGAQQMIDDLITCIEGADLVVFDSFALAAPLAASVARIPAIHHLLGPPPPLAAMALAGDAAAPLWHARDREPVAYGGVYAVPTLNICPPLLGSDGVPSGTRLVPLRPVTLDAGLGDTLPPWLDGLPGRRTVYMTLGTVTNSDRHVFRAVLDGLADEPLNLIITVGRDNDPQSLGPLPDNAHAECYIPQSMLMPFCDAVISHGGSGTMLTTLSSGLPHLMIPQGADQYVNAEVCIRAGVAERLQPSEVRPASIRDRVRSMLRRGAATRDALAVARAQIQSMPSPEDVVSRLRADFAGAAEASRGRRAAAAGQHQ